VAKKGGSSSSNESALKAVAENMNVKKTKLAASTGGGDYVKKLAQLAKKG